MTPSTVAVLCWSKKKLWCNCRPGKGLKLVEDHPLIIASDMLNRPKLKLYFLACS